MKKILINHLILQVKEQLKKERERECSWLVHGVAASLSSDKQEAASCWILLELLGEPMPKSLLQTGAGREMGRNEVFLS